MTLEVAARSANPVAARVRAAWFLVAKGYDAFGFTAVASLPKQKAMERVRGE